MSISKTTILGWFMTFSGFATVVGLDFDMNAIGAAFSDAWDAGVALYGLVLGPILVWLRSITSNPLLGGIFNSILGRKG